MHSQVENILREHFGGADYSIANRQESVDYMTHISGRSSDIFNWL
mgnify:CR=1 FL=1